MQQQQQRHQQGGLLGPRPATLKVTDKKKKKLFKRPVIIYVKSPKVVHAHPSEFKSVVQRLTGAPPSAAHLLPLQFPFQLPLVATTTTASSSQLPLPYLPADAAAAAASSVVTSLGLLVSDDDHQLISPFLYDYHQSMVTVAAGAHPHAVPPPPSLLGACYHRHGDLFINQL